MPRVYHSPKTQMCLKPKSFFKADTHVPLAQVPEVRGVSGLSSRPRSSWWFMVTPLTIFPSLSLCYEKESTLSVDEARTMLTLKAGTVEKVADSLLPSFQGGNISVTTFSCVYLAFTASPQVLGQLFHR